MSVIFNLTSQEWEDLVKRMHGEGVTVENMNRDFKGGIAVKGTVQDMILWVSHVADLIENQDGNLMPAMQHVRYLADRIRWDGADTWFLSNIHCERE